MQSNTAYVNKSFEVLIELDEMAGDGDEDDAAMDPFLTLVTLEEMMEGFKQQRNIKWKNKIGVNKTRIRTPRIKENFM